MPSDIPPRGGAKRPVPSRPSQAPKRGKQASFQAKKRRQQELFAGIGILVVVAVIVVFVVAKAGGGSSSGIDARSAIAPSALAEVQGVTPAQMKAATTNLKLSSYPIQIGTTTTLTSAGKPEVLYIGAEYCPYCAGERWAMVMALSQFGTFSGLRTVTSSPTDTVAAVPTFTFYQATYTSPYVVFHPVETQTVSGKTLETPTAQEVSNEQKYDGPPYVSSGGIPYMNFGGRWIQDGINFDNTSMQHKSFAAMASEIGSQSTPTAGAIAATAGMMISHICALTGGKSLNNNAACNAFPSVISAGATS